MIPFSGGVPDFVIIEPRRPIGWRGFLFALAWSLVAASPSPPRSDCGRLAFAIRFIFEWGHVR